MRAKFLFPGMAAAFLSFSPVFADSNPSESRAAPSKPPPGTRIGEITYDRHNVFDTDNPDEDNWLYRLANRLHIVTRERVIRRQLLFETGDVYDQRLVDESERILRQNRYLYDATIRNGLNADGTARVTVQTRDVWTLGPDLSLSRKGGKNTGRIGIEEMNLFGLGQFIRLTHEEDIDRRSNSFEYADRQLGDSWFSTYLRVADNSDGESQRLRLVRPFYALDARWSAGGDYLNDDSRDAVYVLGVESAEYQRRRRFFNAFGGWSKGLRNGWTTRWTAGVVYDDSEFSDVAMPSLPALIPANRKLVYPYVAVEWLQDRFETASNRDQISRTEDFYVGTRYAASLGYASEDLGSDRDAMVFSATASSSIGSIEKKLLLLSGSLSGRLESGSAVNTVASMRLRYYLTQSPKRLFFASLAVRRGRSLDIDNPVQLGGDNGLRGFPIRYQRGNTTAVVSIEQRYFTDWYPFRLVRVGAAVFADAGRAWGRHPLGEQPLGWLSNIGFGLRLAPTRSSSNKLVHIDVAFPLNGDPSIDDVQFLIESKRSF